MHGMITEYKLEYARNTHFFPGCGIHACNPSPQEAEAGGSHSQPGLYCEFKASLDYIVKACLKKAFRKKYNCFIFL
jgi:hypothetical protein